MLGSESVPDTPRTVFPVNRFAAVRSDTAAEANDTVPPVVYPEGIVTVPALVEIVPEVEPLFAIEPETDPDEP